MPNAAAVQTIKTYDMAERSDDLDFYIRDQNGRKPLTKPHRHEYFQIQVNLDGDTQQHIGAAVRPFRRGCLSFVLPYRVHMVPHPDNARFVLVNFSQHFLFAALEVDPLDLEDVDIARTPELAPFLFQEHMDFMLDTDAFTEVQRLLALMREESEHRRLGSLELIRAYLLQLLVLVCRRFEPDLLRLAAAQAQRRGRSDALGRVVRYIRDNLHTEIALADAAEAASLSPNYLAHLLKKESGKTFVELVTERRIAYAQELLAHTAMRITEIARATGFADDAYFTRRFKQWVGVSPRAFRDGHAPPAS